MEPQTTPQLLPGLITLIEHIEYIPNIDESDVDPKRPHTFRYRITIYNKSRKIIKLLGRKWWLKQTNGKTVVVEGSHIVGQTPILKPGERFTYNSTHNLPCNAQAHGLFFGRDRKNNIVLTPIPLFGMVIPQEENQPIPYWGNN
jgi:ApaG protein